MSPPKTVPVLSTDPSNRRVLGDVSPNLKKHASPAISALRGKPMMGSPLKRSFTAAMEGGEGFTYLKKRKLSDDEYLSDRNAASMETSQSQLGDGQFRPLLPPEKDVPEIHEPSPTEPNTPSSENDYDTQGSSEERKSFSSLINYDPSSQTSNLVLKTVSNAEKLRLRLRVAMYKVRTNQVDVPFRNLQIQGSASGRVWRSPTQEAVEEAVAELRKEALEVRAREEAKRQQRAEEVPKLLPAPTLKPTAYSSRMIYDSGYPSSPPTSKSPERLPGARLIATPRRQRTFGIQPDSAEKCDGACEQELTSSVVKGRVAEGLLGLRHAV